MTYRIMCFKNIIRGGNLYGQKNIYPSDYDDAVIETTANYNPMPCNLSWVTKHTENMMMEQAMLDAGQDKLSAQLARGCMENIGSLAMTAEQLSNMNPDVANCYRAIIAVYTKNAMTRLERRD